MKSLLRSTAFYSFGLFLTSQIFSGLNISGGVLTYVLAGFILSLLFLIVKPILTILTLPLTIITLGWFSLIINAIILYLLTIFVAEISISAFQFSGIAFAGFIIPSFSVSNFFAFILISILLSFIVGVLKWLIER